MKTNEFEDRTEPSVFEQYHSDMVRGVQAFAGLDDIEVVIGVPFGDEDDTLPDVIRTITQGIQAGLLEKALVLCVGSAGNRETLGNVLAQHKLRHGAPVHGFLLSSGLDDLGWRIRAIMEAASKLNSLLLVLPPNLVPQPNNADEVGQGFSPSWIPRLLRPVRDFGQDLALAKFNRHPLTNPVESLLAYPIMAGIWGFRLSQPMPGVFTISHKLMRSCLSDADVWCIESGSYGFGSWLNTRALVEDFAICEVQMGTVSFSPGMGKLKRIFRQITHCMLEQITTHADWWSRNSELITTPRTMRSFTDTVVPRVDIDTHELRRRFKLEFDHFDETLFREIIPEKFRERMEHMADKSESHAMLTAEEWIRVLREFILAYSFDHRFHPDDIVDGLYPFFLARLVGFIDEVKDIQNALSAAENVDVTLSETLAQLEAVRLLKHQADLLVEDRLYLCKVWNEHKLQTVSYLPRLGAWEFVPHVEVIVPQELTSPDGESILASQVYQEQIDRYRGEFTRFLSEQLGIEEVTDSAEVLSQVHRFMHKLDWTLDVDLFHFNLATAQGTREMTEDVFKAFADGKSYQLTTEVARTILKQIPPRHLIAQLGCGNVGSLLDLQDPGDTLGMAAWTDRHHYLNRVLDIIEKRATPSWFHKAPLKPVVVDISCLTNATELRGTSALSRLAGRLVVSNLKKGTGGEFPKLWFFLKVIKSIVGVELFSKHWQDFASSSHDFGQRVVASIRGHWGRGILSAHNAFENQHQRILVERLKHFADSMAEHHPDKANAALFLKAAANVYHLSITLPDATFVPLSAWTWASYSHRGGIGTPTPLSSLVERDWATRDFITAYLEKSKLGGNKKIDDKIAELIGKGRESEDLREHVLGMVSDPDRLVVVQTPDVAPPLASKLVRPIDGPILEPLSNNSWESRYVLNAAAVRLDNTVHILYRALGDDGISRIGLAWTNDGIHIDGRLDNPIFEPGDPTESAGCEDPRVTVIDGRLYMLYTAWDFKLPQISMASIPVQAFLDRRFDQWERHGLGFPGLSNKDAVIYPEKFDKGYVLYHRLDPNMWISYLDDLTCPWPRTGQKIVIGPRPGMMWDGVKIGAGAQPIKTTHGWLNIYHGVDFERSYRLGVLFMDLNDPAKVIYQSPNPILEPETEFEIGKTPTRDYWVPHVVFTCGAVPAKDKAVVGLDDEILVYYGAADTAIGVAKGKLKDLVPILAT